MHVLMLLIDSRYLGRLWPFVGSMVFFWHRFPEARPHEGYSSVHRASRCDTPTRRDGRRNSRDAAENLAGGTVPRLVLRRLCLERTLAVGLFEAEGFTNVLLAGFVRGAPSRQEGG